LKRVILLAVAGAVALAASPLFAQSQEEVLEKMAKDLGAASKKSREQAGELAKEAGWPVKGKTSRGRSFELQGIQNGFPRYYITSNLESAKTTRTDSAQVYIGGGAGVTIGLWDGGSPRLTHQELTPRVTWADAASPAFDDHATHTAGTLIGAGVKPEAKGMAPEGRIKAYEWNDDLSEMANEASRGLLVSSHSYGLIRGWFEADYWYWFGDSAISETTDYRFGFYDDVAQQLDALSFAAPKYLAVIAAGNDRGDGPPTPGTRHYYFDSRYNSWRWSTKVRDIDGGPQGYDCIANGFELAKNSLTVGAVQPCVNYTGPSDVVMAFFSSTGPSDDGRIKPDIVADGWHVYSSVATTDTSYEYYYGTSMATPNVCGSLALLQKYYSDSHQEPPMRAATLKALAIHTAREAGPSPGPDYDFGWGLLDTYAAYREIAADAGGRKGLIEELRLNEGTPLELAYQCDGSAPELRATICWTDPPGTPPAPALNPPDRMLVNDLDLRVSKGDTTYMPWVLDPADPASPATTGDNIRDNVEQIVIPTPEAGVYVIKIDHKGSLRGSAQNFSLIVSGAELTHTWNLYAGGSGDAPSIAAAVDSAQAGDLILLYPGVFREHDIVVDKPVVIKGVGGPFFTQVDAQGLGRCFVVTASAGGARIEDLTLMGGKAMGSGAFGEGGAILCSSAATIVGCTVKNSVAAKGGGVFVDTAPAAVRNCNIYSNRAAEQGGGMYLFADGVSIDHTVIAQNGSLGDGGGVYCGAGNPVLSNCTISHNNAAGLGGGACVTGGAPTFQRCIISFTLIGAGLYWSGGAPGAALSCCDVFGNLGGNYGGAISDQTGVGGNVSVDPQYCNAGALNFGVGDGSPCRPDGNACGVLIGARPVGCHSRTLWRVNAAGTGDAATIQAAIDHAVSGDTIVLASGTYSGDGNRDIDFKGKDVLLVSAAGADSTIIDCGSSAESVHGGFNFITAEDSTAVLDGLTVKNASYVGVWCTGSSPTIRNCRIIDNVFFGSEGTGGGVHLDASSSRVSHCVISHNRSTTLGAGLYLHGGSPRVDHCDISNNFSQKGGGGVSVQSGTSADISSCTMNADTATENGGALYVTAATVGVDSCTISGSRAVFGGGVFNGTNGYCTLTNSVLYGNSASSGGGGAYSGTNMTVTNCTIAGNYAGFYGGGVEFTYGDRNPMTRVIVASNTNGAGIYTISTAQTISCSDVYGNAGGNYAGKSTDQTGNNNNISVDASFCNAAGGDYHLYDTSPWAPGESPGAPGIGGRRGGGRIAPNLVLSRVVFSNVSPAAHAGLTATVAVKNTGVAAADTVVIDFWKNRALAPAAGQPGDERFVSGALAVGDSIVWTTSQFTSDTIGSWRSWFAVDNDGRVVETSERDNVNGPIRIEWRIPRQAGWNVAAGTAGSSSPLLADLDGTPGTLEVVVGSADGTLYAWNAQGALLAGWPVSLGDSITGSAAAGDIAGDGRAEIVIGGRHGDLYAFDAGGSKLWQFSGAGPFDATPALADIDADGKLEIICGAGGHLYALDGSGVAARGSWPVDLIGTAVSSAAVADIDADGSKEIAVASTGGAPAISYLFLLTAGGTPYGPSWPKELPTALAGDPVFGDVALPHSDLELVVAGKDSLVYAFRADGSSCFPPCRIAGTIISGPILSDFDRDGLSEIAVSSKRWVPDSGPGHWEGWVTIVDNDGCILRNEKTGQWTAPATMAPPLAMGKPIGIVAGAPDSTLHAGAHGFPVHLGAAVIASPAAGDIDGDGILEIVVPCSDDTLRCYELCSPSFPADAIGWMLFRRNAERTGSYGYEPVAGIDDGGKKEPPAATALVAIYPNPFNPTTRIRFDVSERSHVEISVFDIAGRRVARLVNADMDAGRFEAVWDGRTVAGGKAASGVYFCTLKVGRSTQSRKMVLLR
jgi:hypothetical protein